MHWSAPFEHRLFGIQPLVCELFKLPLSGKFFSDLGIYSLYWCSALILIILLVEVARFDIHSETCAQDISESALYRGFTMFINWYCILLLSIVLTDIDWIMKCSSLYCYSILLITGEEINQVLLKLLLYLILISLLALFIEEFLHTKLQNAVKYLITISFNMR